MLIEQIYRKVVSNTVCDAKNTISAGTFDSFTKEVILLVCIRYIPNINKRLFQYCSHRRNMQWIALKFPLWKGQKRGSNLCGKYISRSAALLHELLQITRPFSYKITASKSQITGSTPKGLTKITYQSILL